MTKKHSGGFTAVLVIIIAIALVGASGYLAAEMMKNKSSAKGDSAFENGRYEEAFEYYKEADKYSLRPDAKIVKGLAKSAFKSGNTEEQSEWMILLASLAKPVVDATCDQSNSDS